MPELPATTIIAASASILGSAWNSGGQAMMSILAIPGLLSATSPVSSQLLAQQWAGIYNRGKVLGPQTAVISLLGYGYLMYDRSSRLNSGWGDYLCAMGLTIGIVPFTLIIMDPTNQALLRVAEGSSSLGYEAVRELLVRWKGLNLIRSLFPIAGALLGLYGLVGPQ
ncbi:Noranthrone monooxygenase [Cytospora mali]|uniref:Noranthrone monooxygenase n=1 Tax=Cytospora mali TaxID=578113 RepID=A0A194UZG8_CYTMA|nr:Noranthrone monooxygenase [Valsa mali var. pyri (nom. inval.)]